MSGSGERADTVAELLSRYVDRLLAGEELDFAAIRAAHPEAGEELVRHLRSYAELGVSSGAPAVGALGDYRIIRQLGRGGMGVVYEAWQGAMERAVALKVLPSGLARDGRMLERFVREAKAAGSLSHPAIVSVFGMGIEGGTPYIAMELVAGETLEARLGRSKLEEIDTAACLRMAGAFADGADGLHHAHSKGVIHRDLKPSNLMFEPSGRLRLLDFGLARLEGQESITLSGDLVGTPRYMSPEQARVRKTPIDYRTDIYSLGATLYEALTLRPPFQGRDHAETLAQILECDPLPPRQLNPRVPPDLETIVLKCLRKDPAERYGTAEALAQDLRRCTRREPVEARPETRWARLVRGLWRHRVRAALAVLLLALAALGGAQARSLVREAQRRRVEQYETLVSGAMLRLELATVTQREQAAEAAIPWDFWESPFPSLLAADPLEEARQDLTRAVELLPARPDARFHLARTLVYQARQLEALAALDRASPPEAPFVPALALKARVLEARGDSALAAAVMDEARRAALRPWQRAWCESTGVDGTGAVPMATYDVLVEATRGEEPFIGSALLARLRRAAAALAAEDPAQAVRDCAVARSLAADAVVPTLFEARAWLAMGRAADAEALFRSAWEKAPNRDEAAVAIAAIHASWRSADGQRGWLGRIANPSVREERLAKACFESGEWSEAEDGARRAIALDPRNAEAYVTLAWVYEGQGRRDLTIATLEAGLAHRPDSVAILRWLAGACRMSGRLRQAIDYYERAARLSSNPSILDGYLACCYLRLGDEARARELYRQAIEANPRYDGIYNNWAISLHLAGRLEEAVDVYDRAIEISPGWSWLRANKAGVLLDQGRLEEAIACCQEAKQLLPHAPGAYLVAARALLELRRPLEAVGEALGLLEKEPAPETGLILLRLARDVGKAADARAIETLCARVEKVLEMSPANAGAWSALALLRGELAGGEARESSLDAALRGCDLAEAAGEPGDAHRRALREVCARAQDSGACRLSVPPRLPPLAAIDDLAATLESADELRRCLDLVPRLGEGGESPDAPDRRRYLEALLLERLDRRDEALEQLRPLAAGVGARPEAIAACVRVLGRSQRSTEAEDLLRAALEQGASQDRGLWDLWLEIQLAAKSPAAILAALPAAAAPTESTPRGARHYREDIRWLLESLGADASVRIRCGGAKLVSPDGVEWSEDRFFLGGEAAQVTDVEIRGAAVPEVYRSRRQFRELIDDDLGGYRVPLPAGSYRVRLHFGEADQNLPGCRRFDVMIADQEVKDLDVCREAGFRTALVKSVTVRLEGAPLEIRFRPRRGDPMVSGIEVERAD